MRNSDITHKANNDRYIQGESCCTELLFGSLDKFGFLLEQQYHCAPNGDELQWLVAGVENKNSLSQDDHPLQRHCCVTYTTALIEGWKWKPLRELA